MKIEENSSRRILGMSSSHQKLTLKQTQTLKMTQSLHEAIGLLQIPAAELQTYLSQHLEENPLLELVDDIETESHLSSQERDKDNSDTDAYDDEYLVETTYSDREDFISSTSKKGNLNSDLSILEKASPTTIIEDLLTQAAILFIHPTDLRIAEYFIHNLDESGFLREDFLTHMEASLDESTQAKNVLETLKSLDPVGIFTKNPLECLTLQLKRKNIWDRSYEKIIENLSLVGSHEWKKLQKITHLSLDDLQRRIFVIKSLNPKPLEASLSPVQLRIPDLILEKIEGTYRVFLNHEALPKIRLNHSYMNSLSERTTRQEHAYLRQQEREGTWLLKALEKRASTLLKVGHLIAKKQQAFLDHGLRYLKPLTLTEIAKDIDVHESTVSRVVSHKYIQCHSGIYDLKFFFSHGVKNAPQKEHHTNKFIQDRLQKLTEQEPTHKPYSDEILVQLLHQEGITIARRTIAKYRDLLGIGPASLRKRIKSLST